jgi:hypothetical protein
MMFSDLRASVSTYRDRPALAVRGMCEGPDDTSLTHDSGEHRTRAFCATGSDFGRGRKMRRDRKSRLIFPGCLTSLFGEGKRRRRRAVRAEKVRARDADGLRFLKTDKCAGVSAFARASVSVKTYANANRRDRVS